MSGPEQNSGWYSGSEKDLANDRVPGIKMATASIEKKAVIAAADLLRSLGATEVFIFGSAIRGELRPDSDVDLAVIGLPAQAYFSAISKASDLLGRPVDLVDLEDSTPLARYLLGSGELVRVA
jgi:predicted nucleotidyltransferase